MSYIYELKIYGKHTGEFECHKGSMSQLLKAYYNFLSSHNLAFFQFEKCICNK